MNVMKMCVRWLIMTMKFVVVNLVLGGVLNLISFGPLESWLCGNFELSEFSDGSGYMEDVEDVVDMEGPTIWAMRIDAGRVDTEG